nr:hypothetical protein CFP56_14992 [Quercus suber]
MSRSLLQLSRKQVWDHDFGKQNPNPSLLLLNSRVAASHRPHASPPPLIATEGVKGKQLEEAVTIKNMYKEAFSSQPSPHIRCRKD